MLGGKGGIGRLRPQSAVADRSMSDRLGSSGTPPERRTAPEDEPSTVERLPDPPSVGTLASTWRSRIATDEWSRPALAADFGDVGRFRVVAASHIGRRHENEAEPRQDAYAFAAVGSKLVCALADGVSESRFAAPAADIAVSTATGALAERLAGEGAVAEDLLRQAVEHAAMAIEDFMGAVSSGRPWKPSECATTLVLLVLEPRPDHVLATCASVGDSSAFTVSPDGRLEAFVGVDEDTAGGPLRDFLPRRASDVVVVRSPFSLATTVVLGSDGLVRDLVRSEMVRNWFADRLPKAKGPLGAAHLLGYSRRGSSDDRSFVAAHVLGRDDG